MDQYFTLTATDAPLSIPLLMINLAVGLALALILRWHFKRFAGTLSNRNEFDMVIPFVLLTTILIITVVKSSLALSLGLVGALSIVRFRTPIKEPEELAYLFTAIAIGLGLGANHTIPTLIASVLILGAMGVISVRHRRDQGKHLYITLDWSLPEQDSGASQLDHLNHILISHTVSSNLRRFDIREHTLEATYLVDLKNNEKLAELTRDLHAAFPGAGITFLDQSQTPQF